MHAKFGGSCVFFADIGAVRPLIGSVFVRSQIADMEGRGFKFIWQNLPTPEYMRGIGRGCQRCSKYVHLVGAFHDGKFIGYCSPVQDEDPARPETPFISFLHGLTQFAGMSIWFDSKFGKLCFVFGVAVSMGLLERAFISANRQRLGIGS